MAPTVPSKSPVHAVGPQNLTRRRLIIRIRKLATEHVPRQRQVIELAYGNRSDIRVDLFKARDRCGEQAQAAAGKSVSSSVEPGGGMHSVMIRQASECERYAPPFRRLGRAPRDRRAIAPRSWSPRR